MHTILDPGRSAPARSDDAKCLVFYHPTNNFCAAEYRISGIPAAPRNLGSEALLTALDVLKKPYFNRATRVRLIKDVIRPLRRYPPKRFFSIDETDLAVSRALELAEHGTELNRRVWECLAGLTDGQVAPLYPEGEAVLIECRIPVPGSTHPGRVDAGSVSDALHREMVTFALTRGDWLAPTAIHRVQDPYETGFLVESIED